MSKAKFIYFLIIIGIICNAVSLYFYQQNLKIILTEQKFGWYTTVGFVGDAFISIASVLSFFAYKSYFPTYIKFCYIALVLIVVVRSVGNFNDFVKTPSLFYSTKGIGTFVNFGILFYTVNTFFLKKIFKLFYFLCFVIMAAAFYNVAKIGLTFDRHTFLQALREFAVYLIWVFPFFLFDDTASKMRNLVNYLMFFLLAFIVIATGSRGYLILYFIMFVTKLYYDNKRSKSAGILILGGALVLGVLLFAIIRSTNLSSTIDSALNIFTGRVNDDTRTGQLEEFMRQYNYDDAITGAGPISTYYSTENKGQYAYLDNQYMLLGWWAGIPACLIYIFYLFRTFLKKTYQPTLGPKLMLGLWILACGGLAIYAGLTSDLYFYFISMLIGTIALAQTKPQFIINVS